MPKQRNEELIEATKLKIKETAQLLMAERGTAGLSLRAIAQRLAITAPAIYHYFASLDELITALIVDAFTDQADFIAATRDQAAATGAPYAHQLMTAVLAYRQWALANPLNFQLIYGNPIPGYQAPAEVTAPAARQVGALFLELLVAGIRAGEFASPTIYDQIPPTVLAHYQQRGLEGEMAAIFHQLNYVWSIMHGMVMLEINNHATPVVGDPAAFYAQAVRQLLVASGVPTP